MSSRRDSHGHSHSHSKSCANCQSRPAEKGRPDSLCAKCVHKLPRSQCHYCRVAIHLLARHADRPANQHLCDKCSSEAQLYGVPRICQLCKFQAAFDGAAQCRHCQSSFERFGAAVHCDKCGYDCAFQKDAESLQKVDGQTLCFICTHSYKALRKKEGGSGGEPLTETQRTALQSAWQRRDAEKRPREEDVEAELQRQQQQQSNKRQRTEGPAAAASAAAAAAAPSASPSASPSPSPSPQPASSAARSSPTLSGGASPFSLAALSSPSLGSSISPASSTAELLARISKLEKENADLRRGNEERTQKLLVLGARAAESKKAAEDAVAERMRRDKEVNQLRGELEAAKRALVARKDLDASKAQTEALRSLAATGPNPNNAANAKVAAQDDEDTADIKI